MLHHQDHGSAVLTARLNNVDERLGLEFPTFPPKHNRDVPGNSPLPKPILLGFPVQLGEELHGPVVDNQHGVVVQQLKNIHPRFILLY